MMLFNGLGIAVTDDDMDAMIHLANEDGDASKVNFNEFCKANTAEWDDTILSPGKNNKLRTEMRYACVEWCYVLYTYYIKFKRFINYSLRLCFTQH